LKSKWYQLSGAVRIYLDCHVHCRELAMTDDDCDTVWHVRPALLTLFGVFSGNCQKII